MSGFFAMIRNSLGGGAVNKVTRSVARDRLSVMLVHQRNSDFVENIDMDALQKEVAQVIQKYIKCADKVKERVRGMLVASLYPFSVVKSFICITHASCIRCTNIYSLSFFFSNLFCNSPSVPPALPCPAYATGAETRRGRVRLPRDALPARAELAGIATAGYQDEAGRAEDTACINHN
jgi:hypothetical protein